MTNKKETAGKVMTAFYRSCLGKNPTFQDDKIAVAAALREVVNQLQYDNTDWQEPDVDMVLDACDILDVIEELEAHYD
jgi:glyceraldehyde-3-phosphate dehydrogenase/erythrose-4-phosphate dehydrogenase